jgi:tetratricopeptide (TPR) repeat protein
MNKNKSLTIEEAFNLAIKNHQESKTDNAEKLYNQVLKIDPNYLPALNNLGVLYKKLGKHNKAKSCYEKAITLNPNNIDILYNLGNIFQKLEEYQKAKDYYEKVIKINPNYTDAYNNLGVVFQKLGKYQKAKNCYEKVITIIPNYAEAHNNLGIMFQKLEEYQKAINCYEKAIQINPIFADAHNNLGKSFKELGENQKAIDFYEKTIEINPNHLAAQSNLGHLFFEIEEFEKAKNCFKKAIQIKPDDIIISNSLLTSLYKMNNQSILFKELDSRIKNNKMNAVIGSICSRAEVKYGTKKENPFCNDPLNYVLKTDLTEKYDFKNVIVKSVNNILKSDIISSRTQKLLTNGYQTAGNLFTNEDFDTNEIQKIIHSEIEKYRLHFKDSKEGFLKNWPTKYSLIGWLINMNKGGKLSPHMHELGWLSGSVYVNVPKKLGTDSGNLVVCIDDDENITNKNKKSINVVTGSMCLFPSSLLHYTIPFEAEEERVVLAFDMKAE